MIWCKRALKGGWKIHLRMRRVQQACRRGKRSWELPEVQRLSPWNKRSGWFRWRLYLLGELSDQGRHNANHDSWNIVSLKRTNFHPPIASPPMAMVQKLRSPMRQLVRVTVSPTDMIPAKLFIILYRTWRRRFQNMNCWSFHRTQLCRLKICSHFVWVWQILNLTRTGLSIPQQLHRWSATLQRPCSKGLDSPQPDSKKAKKGGSRCDICHN